MARTIVDLSQDIYNDMPVYTAHLKTRIFPYESHADTASMGFKYTFRAMGILMSDHGGTHVDALNEYGQDPKDKSIDQIPLEWVCTEGICLDLSHLPAKAWITTEHLQEALKKSKSEIKRGDTVLLYTGHYNKRYGSPAYATDYPGLKREAMLWLWEKGARNVGVDTPSIDQPDDWHCEAHKVCVEKEMLNTEHLANLDKVASKRFLYVGVPLKLRGCTGSPIRAIAILEQ